MVLAWVCKSSPKYGLQDSMTADIYQYSVQTRKCCFQRRESLAMVTHHGFQGQKTGWYLIAQAQPRHCRGQGMWGCHVCSSWFCISSPTCFEQLCDYMLGRWDQVNSVAGSPHLKRGRWSEIPLVQHLTPLFWQGGSQFHILCLFISNLPLPLDVCSEVCHHPCVNDIPISSGSLNPHICL